MFIALNVLAAAFGGVSLNFQRNTAVPNYYFPVQRATRHFKQPPVMPSLFFFSSGSYVPLVCRGALTW